MVLYRLVEGTAYYFLLLFLGQLVEINRISRYSYGQVGVKVGVFHSIYKLFTVKNIYIDMVRILHEVTVKDTYKVGFSVIHILAESRGNYGECVGYTVTATVIGELCHGVKGGKSTAFFSVVHGICTG